MQGVTPASPEGIAPPAVEDAVEFPETAEDCALTQTTATTALRRNFVAENILKDMR